MGLICSKGCGQCCKVGGTGMVLPVTAAEAAGIADALGVTPSQPVTVLPNLFDTRFIRAADCPALGENGECRAYDARPQVCRDFQCNGEERFTHSEESLKKLHLLAQRQEPVADLRDFLPEPTERALNRHERIAFQFSAGKDSTAALLLLKPYWDRFTVYYCDSGDSMPETLEIVEKFSGMLPRFEIVRGRVNESRSNFGWPTDLLPWTSAFAAHTLNAGTTPLLQDRAACCFRAVMEPMHERMLADGITLIIRGQKSRDSLKGPLRSGNICDGIEFLYPVEGWTDDECFAFMRKHSIELQRFYSEGLPHSGDCMSCTAWTEDDRSNYLKKYHPNAFEAYRHNMRIIADAALPYWKGLIKEAQNCEE